MLDTVAIVAADPGWPAVYAALAADVRRVLGAVVIDLEHVGSTAVPDLAGKDVVDLDLTVADPADEAAYVGPLVSAGWRHVIREPAWYGHRMLRLERPRANLHVWGPDCPEALRHRMFRDWLRARPDERRRYEAAKRAAVGPGTVADYNARKQAVVREIYARAFAAAGLR